MFRRLLTVGLIFLSSLVVAEDNVLLGTGASFPYPLYSKMFKSYYDGRGVKINYQSLGSGAGIRQLKNKTVHFGASDAFLDAKTSKTMPGDVLHIPTALGAVAITFNLDDIKSLKI